MHARIATYNLFEGAGGSYNRLVEFVREAKLDVLCLQEVNGWQDGDNARLKDFTDKTLFTSFAYGNSNTEFKLATLTKHAITGKTLHAEAFWHAALETKIQLGDKTITIINVHQDPRQEASRAKEVARILAAIKPGEPTIITGDFNSLSRKDNYPPSLLQELQAKGISKFGAGALDFTVTDTLERAGFVDAAAQMHATQTTVPSPYNTDQAHEVPVRVDYVFVSPDLAPYVRSLETVKNELTNAISDHYPVIVTLAWGEDMALPVVTVQPEMVSPPFMPAAGQPLPQPPGMPSLPPEPPKLQTAADPSAVTYTAPEHIAEDVPAAPHPSYREYPHPAKPWTPDGMPDAANASAENAPGSTAPAPPKPPKDDGGVTMWSHNTDDDTPGAS
jgi:endonuclease/exonuclease/phosphatase family metal-dependent hydrolase